MSFSKRAELNPRLRAAMIGAVSIGVGPGSVYSSGIPGLLAGGTAETLADAQDHGTVLAITGNLVNQTTETTGWNADRYVRTYEEYLADGRKFDVVILNEDTDQLDPEKAVSFDRADLDSQGYKVVATSLVSKDEVIRQQHDLVVTRTDVEHDMKRLGEAFVGQTVSGRTQELVNI